MGGEDLLDARAEQPGRSTLARDVAQRESQHVLVEDHVLEEVSTDHATRDHQGSRIKIPEGRRGFWQQRLLELVCGPEVLLQARLVLRFSIEARALDRHRRFVRERFQRRSHRGRTERLSLAGV